VSVSEEIGFVPVHWLVTNEEYHGDLECDSNSTLKLFLENRRKYYRKRILREQIEEKYSLGMNLGSALHIRLMPAYADEYQDRVEVVSSGEKSGAFAEAVRCNEGKIILPASECYRVDAMEASVRRNPYAMQLIESVSSSEHAVRFLDAATKRPLKVMFDILTAANRIVDIKTTKETDDEGISRALFELGYYRQSALYCTARDLYRPFLGDDVPGQFAENGFTYIFVSNNGDFDCRVRHIDTASLNLGASHNAQILQSLADCRDFWMGGEWQNHGVDEVRHVGVPPWSFNKELNL